MSLRRRNLYDPFAEMDRVMNQMVGQMRSLMGDALAPEFGEMAQRQDANLLAVDMTSNDKQVVVRTALPGLTVDDVELDVRGNVLTISAESKAEREDEGDNWHIRELRYGKFARSVMLPEEVEIDKAEAALEHGILTVTLPKVQTSPVKKIAVKAKALISGKKES